MNITTDFKFNNFNINFGSQKVIVQKLVREELFNKSERLNNEIKAVIESAIETKTPINKKDIADKLNLNYDMLTARIKANPVLKALLQKAVYRKPITHHKSEQDLVVSPIPDKKLARKNTLAKIKEALIEAINNNQATTLKEIAVQLNIKFDNLSDKIRKKPELNELWKKVPRRSRTVDSVHIENKLGLVLEEICKSDSYASLDDIANKTGISTLVCQSRINRNPLFLELWQIIKTRNPNKGGLKPSPEENFKITNRIKTVLNEIISNNEVVTIPDVLKRLDIKSSMFLNRINSNPELLELWTKVRNIHEKKDNDLVEKLKEILENAIKTGQNLTAPMLKNQLNISSDVLYKRFETFPYLRVLWDKIPHRGVKKNLTEKKIIVKKDNNSVKNLQQLYDKIQKILEEAVESKTQILQREIAELVGIKTYNVKAMIARRPILKDLWAKVERKNVSEESEHINKLLKEKLSELINRKGNISYNELAKYAHISPKSCYARLRRVPQLAELWSNLKQNRISVIKEMRYYKSQNLPDSEIMVKLGLDKESFQNINTEYERIQELISSHKDDAISHDEYLKWATLSKRDFELVVTDLFKKMGYNAKTTSYNADNGIDIIAEKDGKTTYIECVHNLNKGVKASEILELQGSKYYHNADKIILVASSGAKSTAYKAIDMINENVGNNFKIMNLEEIIKLSKKYKVNPEYIPTDSILETESSLVGEKTWRFHDVDNITEEDIQAWKNLPKNIFDKNVLKLFENEGYTITEIPENFLKNSYLLDLKGEKSILNINKNEILSVKRIRALYGMKDCFNTTNVILAGVSALTTASKKFVDKINAINPKSYQVLSLNKLIELSKS